MNNEFDDDQDEEPQNLVMTPADKLIIAGMLVVFVGVLSSAAFVMHRFLKIIGII